MYLSSNQQHIKTVDDSTEPYSVGEKYLSEKNYKQAGQFFDQLLVKEPGSSLAYLRRGQAYAGLEQWMDAQCDWLQAIVLDIHLPQLEELCKQGGNFSTTHNVFLAEQLKLFKPWLAQSTRKQIVYFDTLLIKLLSKQALTQQDNIRVTNKHGHHLLHVAAILGDINLASILLEQGLDINQATYTSKVTALECAAYHGRLEMVQYLLTQGANFNGKTCYYAIHNDETKPEHFQIVKFLLAQGVDVNYTQKHGRTLLYYAAAKGHLALVQSLVAGGAVIDKADDNGTTPLAVAAEEGHLPVVVYLAEQSANIALPDVNGIVPLGLAAQFGHLNIVEYLVKQGADINHATIQNDCTPLCTAADNGHLAVVKFLSTNGADINKPVKDGSTPLHFAIVRKHIEIALYLIVNGANLAVADKVDGRVPLGLAAQNKGKQIVEALLTHGLDVNQPSGRGATPLIIAADDGDLELVQYLIAQGGAINQAMDGGCTALHFAIGHSHFAVVQYLVEHGALINQADAEGNTPLKLAIEDNNMEMVQYLVTQGAALNQATNQGITPLLLAVKENYFECIQYLVEQGADVNQANVAGMTPLDFAIKYDLKTIMTYLMAQGAKHSEHKLLELVVQSASIKMINQWYPKQDLLQQRDTEGNSIIHLAAKHGCDYLLSHYHEQGADLNLVNQAGQTPLYLAARQDHQSIIYYLLEHKASLIGLTDELLPNILETAINLGKLDVVEYFVQPDTMGGIIADTKHLLLAQAVIDNQLAIAQHLVACQADVKQIDKRGNTLLHKAAEQGNLAMLEFLLTQTIDVNQVNKRGETALFISAVEHLSITERLLVAGANMEQADNYGNTALLAAAEGRNSDVVKYLTAQGANLRHVNKEKMTALDLAALGRDEEAVKFLLAQKCLPCLPIIEASTLFKAAITQGELRIVSYLVEHGAALNLKLDSLTPLALAAEHGQVAIVEYLLACGAPVELNRHTLEQVIKHNFIAVLERLADAGLSLNKKYNDLTPLHLAAKLRQNSMIKPLLTLGAMQEWQDKTSIPLSEIKSTRGQTASDMAGDQKFANGVQKYHQKRFFLANKQRMQQTITYFVPKRYMPSLFANKQAAYIDCDIHCSDSSSTAGCQEPFFKNEP
jgi:ankyrin repeat protein